LQPAHFGATQPAIGQCAVRAPVVVGVRALALAGRRVVQQREKRQTAHSMMDVGLWMFVSCRRGIARLGPAAVAKDLGGAPMMIPCRWGTRPTNQPPNHCVTVVTVDVTAM
jgi:hypothetical protein